MRQLQALLSKIQPFTISPFFKVATPEYMVWNRLGKRSKEARGRRRKGKYSVRYIQDGVIEDPQLLPGIHTQIE